MEDHNLVKKLVEVQLVPILDQGNRMLAVVVCDQVPAVAALPVYLNCQVVVSWVQLHLDGSIPIAVDEIVDVLAEVVGDLVDF